MKKYLPWIVEGVVIFIALIVIVLVKFSKGTSNTSNSEENVPEIPQSEWPVVSLTPTADPTVPNSLGHFLDFKVQKINVPGATSMDYELIYSTTSGGQQGVPGTVQLTGSDIDKLLLMGSESSGHFRFDDGVTHGTMTLRFRDSSGKLLGKLATDFHLQFGDTVLTSVDGKYTYTLDKPAKGVYFVTMFTFANGYQVFASDGKVHTGK